MILYRVAFAVPCLAIIALFGWFFRRAYREGRMEYGNFFGRRLYVYRDQHPKLFWFAFAPGLLFCIGLIELAIRGLSPSASDAPDAVIRHAIAADRKLP